MQFVAAYEGYMTMFGESSTFYNPEIDSGRQAKSMLSFNSGSAIHPS
jgi:hypothetical protein